MDSDTQQTKCKDAIATMRSPLLFWEKILFPELQQQSQGEGSHEDDPEPLNASGSVLETMKAEYNKATGNLLHLIFDLMRGNYFQACVDLSSGSDKFSKLVSCEASAVDGTNAKELPKDLKSLISHVMQVVQGFDTHAKSVSLASSLPAPSLLHSLGNGQVDGSAEAEARNHVWKQVQAERKKIISFSCPSSWSQESLAASLRQNSKIHQFSGMLNGSHRLFCASADLIEETGPEPWVTSTPPKDDQWKNMCSFIASLTGTTDFGLAFDGRMRTVRRATDA